MSERLTTALQRPTSGQRSLHWRQYASVRASASDAQSGHRLQLGGHCSVLRLPVLAIRKTPAPCRHAGPRQEQHRTNQSAVSIPPTLGNTSGTDPPDGAAPLPSGRTYSWRRLGRDIECYFRDRTLRRSTWRASISTVTVMPAARITSGGTLSR